MELVNKAISLDSKQTYFLNNRGFVYLSLKEYDKALADINQSISADPYNGWAYRNKGIYYLMQQDYASAERLLVQAEGMDNFIDKIYFYLGMAYQKNNKRVEACKAFSQSEQRGDKMLTADLIKYCN